MEKTRARFTTAGVWIQKMAPDHSGRIPDHHSGVATRQPAEPVGRFTTEEARAITRIFMAIERQIEIAYREDRQQDAIAMARLTGILEVRIFGYCRDLLGDV